MQTAINTVITVIASGVVGYAISTAKNFKKREKSQNKALLSLLRKDLSDTYFIYDTVKKMPDYVYQNFLEELEAYEGLGGNGFIHTIAHKMENWELTKTDVLKENNNE